jgi:hypothetical protein
MKGKQQQGVALVITLILLTIITVIAVAFLAVTHRERASVTETLNSTDSEFAMSAAMERAKAEILGTTLSFTNLFNTELRVSTTFPSFLSKNRPAGVDPSRSPINPDPNNVNFDYDNQGNSLLGYTTPQWENLYRNIGQNLLFDPRAPVFVNTNRGGKTGPLDYRFYLDLNRNGRFEKTGILPVLDGNGQPVIGASNDPNTPGVALTNLFVGDPEWIGVLQFPNLFHSQNNRFIARYAYMIMPAGKSLDLNYIGNQARTSYEMGPQNAGKSGYLRNQGFGTWELNLGAFLTDLNPNFWGGYDYRINDPAKNGNQGAGFYDAVGLLHYRYRLPGEDPNSASPHTNLPSAAAMLGNPISVGALFANDYIDAYVGTNFSAANFGVFPLSDYDDSATPWPGGEPKQHFFRPDDFFDRPSLDFAGFKARLGMASTNTSSYDRYSFYRMLTQLGTDSAPEKDVERVVNTRGEEETIVNKINLNFANVGTDALGNRAIATNLVNWRPIDFFSNTAHVLLKQEFAGYGITNIPVYTNRSTHYTNNGSVYPIFSPRVRQLLQVAANLYEATTNSVSPNNIPSPCVYHPIYQTRGDDVYIVGFEEDHGNSLLTAQWKDLNNVDDRKTLNGRVPVYNIGVIVGARKNLPNFNEFRNLSIVQVSRKLKFFKKSAAEAPYLTNQQFTILVTNSCGTELWNSYTNPIRAPLFVHADFENTFLLTNSTGLRLAASTLRSNYFTLTTNWAGRAFVVPPGGYETVLEPSSYDSGNNSLIPIRTRPDFFDGNLRAFTNAWGLNVTNHFRCFITDQTTGNLLDAVGFAFDNYFDTSKELDKPLDNTGAVGANVWHRLRGITNQIQFSATSIGTESYWRDYAQGGFNKQMAEEFAAFMGIKRPGATITTSTKLEMSAPFTPVRRMVFTNSWQANDPLVHYTPEDLVDSIAQKTNGVATVSVIDTNSLALNLGRSIHGRYRPWGFLGSNAVPYVPTDRNSLVYYDERIKDPLITQPDDWQFPTNKFPNVGWMGRVHRGTPWQTVYLKSFTNELSPKEWGEHAGLAAMVRSMPTNDWRLVDMFTVAIHPNATKGQLSINQTNLAAWSAALSGIGITTLEEDKNKKVTRENRFVEPSANADPVKGDALLKIVNGINRRKAQMPMNQFFRLSDFMSTPELTTASPFLSEPFISKAANKPEKRKALLTDLDYERIPDEILSLLKVGDVRFVVYAYGQSLKPAPSLLDYPSIITTGPYAGMCINYQITGETASRSVIRIDFERVLDPASPDYLKLDYRRPHAVVESFNVLTP